MQTGGAKDVNVKARSDITANAVNDFMDYMAGKCEGFLPSGAPQEGDAARGATVEVPGPGWVFGVSAWVSAEL